MTDDFDEVAVARSALVGDDDAVVGGLGTAGAAKPDAEHGTSR